MENLPRRDENGVPRLGRIDLAPRRDFCPPSPVGDTLVKVDKIRQIIREEIRAALHEMFGHDAETENARLWADMMDWAKRTNAKRAAERGNQERG